MTSLSRLLKESTKEAHAHVERAESVDALITGLLPRDLHVQYLICLYHIYSHLEAHLSSHASHPALCYNHDPLLFRSGNLEHDICHFLELDPSASWQDHPFCDTLAPEVLDALTLYTSRLDALAAADASIETASDFIYPRPAPKPSLLVAHSYVRYMGDLSGGQAIRKSVAAAYGLPLDSIDGQRFYHFGQESSLHELKAFKSRFRHGLDMAGEELTKEELAAVLQEANHAFELNMKLFSSFAPSLHRARAAAAAASPIPLRSSISSTASFALSDASSDSDSSFETIELVPSVSAAVASKPKLLYPALFTLFALLLAVWLGVRRAETVIGLAAI